MIVNTVSMLDGFRQQQCLHDTVAPTAGKLRTNRDRICRCRVLYQTVPLVYRELPYHDGTALSIAVFDVLQQTAGQRLQPRIVLPSCPRKIIFWNVLY